MIKNKIKKFAPKTVLYIVLVLLSACVIFPIFYALMASIKETTEFLIGSNIIPKHIVWDNYKKAFVQAKFPTYTLNSVVISITVTIFSLMNVCILGYCFARVNFVGKNVLRILILSTIFISLGPMTLFPKFLLVKALGINKSILGIIFGIIQTGGAQIFVFEAYFKSQGTEIDEAAVIDGCGFFNRFFRIGVPLAKPLIGTFGVIFFNGAWNDFFWPYILTFNNSKIQPLVVAVISLRDTAGEAATEWGLLMAGASLAIIPVLVVYLFTSRWVISGVTEGATKM
jgi:ABC-type glycerol-3-phosphate transport system permease component